MRELFAMCALDYGLPRSNGDQAIRILFLLGAGTLVAIGLYLVVAGLPDMRRRRALVGHAPVPVAKAPPDAIARIEGNVTPTEAGTFPSPINGIPCVWARLVVRVAVETARLANGVPLIEWIDVLDRSVARPFYVTDESGKARVDTDGLRFIGPPSIDDDRLGDDALEAFPHLKDFLGPSDLLLVETGLAAPRRRRVHCRFEVVGATSHVHVIGKVKRDSVEESSVYRQRADPPPVTIVSAGGEDGLMVGRGSERRTSDALATKYGWGLVLTALGLVVLLAVMTNC